LPDLVEAQARRTPTAAAVVHEGESLTYAELDARANRLARALQDAGVGPEVPAAILLERSIALPVSLLATLKAGGACLPLDPAYPPLRLTRMLQDARPPVLVSSEGLAARLPERAGQVILVDRDRSTIERQASDRPPRGVSPDDLAYLIYTSGSTGEPKGVMLTHRGLVNHNLAVARVYGLAPGDRVVQFCSVGFDVSVEEIFPSWETGAAVVLRPDDLPILGAGWLEWLRRMRITVLNLPTAYWHEWVRDLQSLGEQVPGCVRLVIVGGEKALGSAYLAWLGVGGDRVRWLNAYGPAEASVLATFYEPPPGDHAARYRDPPIGRPLDNTTVHVLDADAGFGELLIGGVGVARGYLNQPELTAERFVTDPDDEDPGARMYRTGDLARLLADGNLEFVGRLDEQVKVRGFRIEPSEVESHLARHPDVAEVAVVAREDEPGDKRLVAYVVPGGGAAPTPSVLRRFLSKHLPRHMLPSAFVRVDALPVTPNGKLDRDALPPPGGARAALASASAATGTPTERVLAAIFSRILGIDEVADDDDFFDLGGHSLQGMQVIAAVRQELGVPLGVGSLFEAPTVAGLAAAVQGARGGAEEPPPLRPRARAPGQRIPLTCSQAHMWRLETTADPAGLFNVTAQHRFSGPVDVAALRRGLAHVVGRHEILRTSFHAGTAGPYQSTQPSPELDLAVCELRAVPARERAAELQQRIAAQDAEPFELAQAPLLRACLYRVEEHRSVAAVTFDHLVCDGTSAYVFLSELTAAYDAFAAGETPALRPLPVQYPDYALWQRGWLTEKRLGRQLEYWKRKLAGMPLGPAVPLDRVPERPSRRILLRPVVVGPERYRGMLRLTRATSSTMFVLTAAAVQALFSRVGGITDIVLSTTLSGRQHAEVDGLIGCFHGVGRIRTDLSGDPSFEEIVHRTRETVIGLLEHQDLPFMRIRQAVLSNFPTGGPALLAAVPVEFQYFHTAHDEWAPGSGVVARPGPDPGPDDLFFRGHLHPLLVSFLDDGGQLWGQLSYKPDFYDEETIERLATGLQRLLTAVTRKRGLRLSELEI
jgi:amino acid adenylation domain-containing protein